MKNINIISLIGFIVVITGVSLEIFHVVDKTIGWTIIFIGFCILYFSMATENNRLKKRIEELEKK